MINRGENFSQLKKNNITPHPQYRQGDFPSHDKRQKNES
jgi:hypothetical protein